MKVKFDSTDLGTTEEQCPQGLRATRSIEGQVTSLIRSTNKQTFDRKNSSRGFTLVITQLFSSLEAAETWLLTGIEALPNRATLELELTGSTTKIKMENALLLNVDPTQSGQRINTAYTFTGPKFEAVV